MVLVLKTSGPVKGSRGFESLSLLEDGQANSWRWPRFRKPLGAHDSCGFAPLYPSECAILIAAYVQTAQYQNARAQACTARLGRRGAGRMRTQQYKRSLKSPFPWRSTDPPVNAGKGLSHARTHIPLDQWHYQTMNAVEFAPVPCHHVFVDEELVADCEICGVLAVGVEVEDQIAHPLCSMHEYLLEPAAWRRFPLPHKSIRIPGVHSRAPLMA